MHNTFIWLMTRTELPVIFYDFDILFWNCSQCSISIFVFHLFIIPCTSILLLDCYKVQLQVGLVNMVSSFVLKKQRWYLMIGKKIQITICKIWIIFYCNILCKMNAVHPIVKICEVSQRSLCKIKLQTEPKRFETWVHTDSLICTTLIGPANWTMQCRFQL